MEYLGWNLLFLKFQAAVLMVVLSWEYTLFFEESNLNLDISYNQSALSFCILQRGIYLKIEVSKGNLLLKF